MFSIQTGDPKLDANTIALRDELTKQGMVEILRGRRVPDIALANATNVDIRHGLGRPVKGWIMCDLTGATAAGVITRGAVLDERTFLRLRAINYGATITVSLWVF